MRALGEEVEADRAELERRAMAYDDPARVKGRVEETLRSRVLTPRGQRELQITRTAAMSLFNQAGTMSAIRINMAKP